MALNTAGRNALLTSGKAGLTHVGALTDVSTAFAAHPRRAGRPARDQAAADPA
jgi:hypothetical protein